MSKEVEASLRYLESDGAMKSLEHNFYWPKWNSPWWHMTLLNEMGLAKEIPKAASDKMVTELKKSPIKIFPIQPHEMPQGLDRSLLTHCHCSLGNIYQALAASGVNVDEELPWIREWFLKYQLPDGGLNCDNEAYLKNPPPSSMVGTIAPLEAVLNFTKREFTPEETGFLDRGACNILARYLTKATTNAHNSEEKEDESDWLKVCFPRFYFYDILRGLTFVLKWAERREQEMPPDLFSEAKKVLETNFPDGTVRIERRSFAESTTLQQTTSGEWRRDKQASTFPLLEHVSQVGEVSPYLTAQWLAVKSLEKSLISKGIIQSGPRGCGLSYLQSN